ncbi:MAG: glycosyltransferase family 4 protein [Armatimonadetes bacterium]|nr:glycosyltransferase family 4 protein [Anaerolineae bacterium]
MLQVNVTNSMIKRIGFIGNHLPRQCGIATFTTDLCEAIATEYSDMTCIALPVNDTADGYVYPPRVRFELEEKDLTSYRRAADFLNINNVDLVCLQHEYGIYGGTAGSHILTLLRALQMPIVTTLHTVLEHPNPDQFKVLKEVAARSERVIVMSERGVIFLRDIYGIPESKIDFIPHGIPDVPFADSSFHKDQFGVEGKKVLLSFGLLSRGKGIEDVITALPAIVAQHPDVMYLLIGATHPQVLRHEGEAYRESLQQLTRDLGVEAHVTFYNRFVTLEELNQFISTADIYITPYLNPAQITSGTLAYTLGAGKAIVSTPYWYAEEMLADGRGVLIPFSDPATLGEAVIDLLSNDAKRDAMRKRAYLFGRAMIWSQVAQRYMESFERARAVRRYASALNFGAKSSDYHPGKLPALNLKHLHQMTDDTGILQHASFTIPNYHEGYCIDDNARALLVSTYLAELALDEGQAFALTTRYLAFISYAFNPKTRRFRNFMDYQRHWLEENGSEDSHGRTLWALGTVIGRSETPALSSIATWLFEQALPAILETTSPRAWAFALVGIHEYLRRFDGDRLISQIRDELATRLLSIYQANRVEEWHWYENELAYCNAVLPLAMLVCGQWMRNESMTAAGIESLNWLTQVQKSDGLNGHFVPIGSNGFYQQGRERARFDQQPVEAQAMISACLEAYRITDDTCWYEEAQCAFDWFLGRNDLHLSLYDASTGGCRDGLHVDRANENQGAESTLAFLQSWLELRLVEERVEAEAR